MNNSVLICLITNERDSYGLARRLALITGRLPVPSSLTLNGLKEKEKEKINSNRIISKRNLTCFQVSN